MTTVKCDLNYIYFLVFSREFFSWLRENVFFLSNCCIKFCLNENTTEFYFVHLFVVAEV
jgi:hypothetical protein